MLSAIDHTRTRILIGLLLMTIAVAVGQSCTRKSDTDAIGLSATAPRPSVNPPLILKLTPTLATIATSTAVKSRTPFVPTATPANTATKIPTPTELPTLSRYVIEPTSDIVVFRDLMWQVQEPGNVIELPFSVGSHPWSPDGGSLVGWDRKNQSLAILDLASHLITPLNNSSARFSGPFWSPDGRFLLGSIPDPTGYSYTVVVYEIATQKETVLAKDIHLLSLAGWSHDSSEIAYSYVVNIEEDDFTTALETVALASNERQTTILPSTMIQDASWSPTTKQLLIYASPNLSVYNPALPDYFHRQLFLLDVDTGDLKQLLDEADALREYWIHDIPWSPSGESIVYSSSGAICLLQLANEGESCFEELNEAINNTGASAGWYPSWSADGEWLAFVLHYENQQCNPVAVAKVDGSDLVYTDVKVGHCSVFGPVWRPIVK